MIGNTTLWVSFNVFIDQSAPTATLQGVTPTARETAVASLDITLSEAVNQATFTRGSFTLTRDGGANLLTPAVTLSRQTDTLYRLNNYWNLPRRTALQYWCPCNSSRLSKIGLRKVEVTVAFRLE